MSHVCPRCERKFVHKSSLSRHKKGCNGVPKRVPGVGFTCPECEKVFSRKNNMQEHLRMAHTDDKVYECGLCPAFFTSREHVENHRQNRHRNRSKFVLRRSAHGRACESYRLYLPTRFTTNFSACIDYCIEKTKELVQHLLPEKRHLKVGVCVSLRFAKPSFHKGGNTEMEALGAQESEVMTFNIRPTSRVFMFGDHDSNKRRLTNMFGEIGERFADFNHRGSGWVLADCLYLDVDVGQCLAMQGSCSIHTVANDKSRVWVRRDVEDQAKGDYGHRCFYHAIASFLLTNEKESNRHPDPRSHSEDELEAFVRDHINEEVESPVPLKKVSAFEEANKHLDIAINVIYSDDEENLIYPAYASPNLKARNQVVLLLFHRDMTTEPGLTEERKQELHQEMLADFGDESSAHLGTLEGMQAVMHYAPVYDVSRIFAKRVSNAAVGSFGTPRITHTRPRYHCFNCFMAFQSYTALTAHTSYCHAEKGQVYVVPEEGSVISYEPKRKSFKLGYTFFFDFETLQVRPQNACSCPPEKVAADKCKHKTKVVYEQMAFAYALVVLDRDGKVFRDQTYVGADAATHFVRSLWQLEKDVNKLISNTEPMVMTDEQKEQHDSADKCYICEEAFENDNKQKSKVPDHDHINGEYIGAAHQICNLHRSEIKKTVGFAHNFTGYDSHILMTALAQSPYYRDEIKAIPLNTEKFKMLRLGTLTLLDSMAFLPASLDKLVENLHVSEHKFPIVEQWLSAAKGGLSKIKKELMMRKGVYPYEHMTSMEVLQEPLPPRDKFFSRLSGTGISEEDYAHVQRVWEVFELENLRDLTELYVLSDTYQVAEAITDLREQIYDEFNIDLCHYLSLPMMTKDIMLKTTGVEMELMHDIDMIFFIRNSIRGGLSFVSTRHSLVGEDTDHSLNTWQPTHQTLEAFEERVKRDKACSIVYADVNNLYGHAMRMSIPLSDFEWLTEDELNAFDPESMVSDDFKTGYILEVTLDYPEHLHVDHNSFPLAPEHVKIDETMLSPYASNAMQTLTRKRKHKASKLTSTLRQRKEYTCHGLNLQLYLRLGMRLVKIHRGIKFTQAKFLKPYIDRCTSKRAAAKTKTAKDLQKLLANSLYGKLIESGTNRMDCRFVTGKKSAILRNTDPRTQAHLIFSEDLSVAMMRKKYIKLNQSWAPGFTVLELSKYHMQKMYYEDIKPAFNGRVSVLISDTDSLMMKLPEPHTDLALSKLKHLMDFSNYPDNHPLRNNDLKNLTGYLKNECPGNEIREVVGVRAKTYAIRTEDDGVQRRCKGVKASTRDQITMHDYRKCVRADSLSDHNVRQYTIQSRKHQNKLLQQQKLAFSSFDDKRYLLPCGQHSVPYGSSLIVPGMGPKDCYFCKNPHVMV